MAIIMAVAHCASPIGQMIYGAAFEAFQTSIWIPVLFISVAMFVMSIVAQRILKNEGD